MFEELENSYTDSFLPFSGVEDRHFMHHEIISCQCLTFFSALVGVLVVHILQTFRTNIYGK